MKSSSSAALGIFLIIALLGCGGGGNSGNSSIKITGVAATGAPLTGATITVYDKTGISVGSTSTNSDGSYTASIVDTAQPPLVVHASRADIGTLVSVTTSNTTGTIVNVSPITNLIASRLSISGDPTKLATEVKTGAATITQTVLQTKVSEVIGIIQPLQTTLGDTTTNPISDATFKADGTKHDALLDLVKVVITPASSTTANVQIALAGASNDISFQSGVGSSMAPPTQPVIIDSTTLPPAINMQAQISGFLTRVNSCLALPANQRVDSMGTITASECKALFWNSDPTLYSSNGKTANQAFINMVNTNLTGSTFDRGVFSYAITGRSSTYSTFSNSTPFVITAREIHPDGSSYLNSQVVIADPNDGNKIKLIGNQWKYNSRVTPTGELRDFPNQPQFSYLDTSYEVFVENTSGVFDHVNVTTPTLLVNNTPVSYSITLKPTTGYSYLVFSEVNGIPVSTNTNLFRMNGAYTNSTTNGTPDAKDNATIYWYPGLIDDATIGAFPLHSKWKFEYFLSGNTTAIPDVTEWRTTLSRAPRVDELKQVTWAQLVSPLSNAIITTAGLYPIQASGAPFSWTVPAGALEPNALQLFGSGWNDGINISTSLRQATVTCSPQTVSDTHCLSKGTYKDGLLGTLLSLNATTVNGMALWHRYALYNLP